MSTVERFENPVGGGFFSRFLAGASFAFGGIAYTMSQKNLRSLAIVPIIINTILFCGLLYLGFGYFHQIVEVLTFTVTMEGFFGSILSFFAGAWELMVSVMLSVIFVVGGLLVTMILGTILAGPIYDLLSERTELLVLGRSHAPPFSFQQMFKDIAEEFILQMLRLSIYLSVVILLFLVGAFVPVIGQIVSSVLSTLWTWLFLSLEFASPNLTRHEVLAGSRIGFMFQHKAANLGFGFGAWTLLFIPFFAPTIFVGATRYFLALAAYDEVESKLASADKVLLRNDQELVALIEPSAELPSLA